jgi:signal transduction histidine kinase
LRKSVSKRETTDLSPIDPSGVQKEVRPLISALNQHMARIANLLASRHRLITDASHQMRTPLTEMRTQIEYSLRQNRPELSHATLIDVHADVDRLARLISQMLLQARSDPDVLPDQRSAPVDLSELARAVAADLQKNEPNRQVEFTITPDLVVRADRGLMRVVLDNLMGNAWKFTGKQPHAHIALGVKKHDGGPAYFVRDDGAGFDMAYVDKLFGAFQRLHGVTEFAGTGIGLATVQRVIHRHGGRVWAESELDRGATFYFTLS